MSHLLCFVSFTFNLIKFYFIKNIIFSKAKALVLEIQFEPPLLKDDLCR